jgi:hypothetical protein
MGPMITHARARDQPVKRNDEPELSSPGYRLSPTGTAGKHEELNHDRESWNHARRALFVRWCNGATVKARHGSVLRSERRP